MKLFMYVWQRKWRIFIVSVLVTAVFFAGSCYNTYYTESMLVSFIYPNSEKGKYPDGTRFNIYDMLSDEVIRSAVELYNAETDKRITVSDVEDGIAVKENMTADILSKVDSARELGMDYAYFTNEYCLTFEPMRRMNFSNTNDLFGIVPYVDNAKFMEKFYKAYVNYFMDKHAEKNILTGFSQEIQSENYDYLEIAERYEDRINMCINYLEGKSAENGAFRSSQTGLTFNDLINSFRNFKDVQVKNLTAFVSASKLTKYPNEFVNRLKVHNELEMLEYNKYKAEAKHAKTAMEQYDHTFEENIVVAGVSDANGLYQTRAKTAYDKITKRAHDAGVKAENIYQDIQENERLIREYGRSRISASERVRLTAAADGMIQELESINKQLIKQANITVEEYLTTKSSDYVRCDVYEKSFVNFGTAVKCGFVFAASAIAVILAMMTASFGKTHRIGKKKVKRKIKAFRKKKNTD